MPLHIPALAREVRIQRLGVDLILAIDEHGAWPLTSRLAARILDLANGRRSTLDISDILRSQATLADVSATIDDLADDGWLVDAGEVRDARVDRPPLRHSRYERAVHGARVATIRAVGLSPLVARAFRDRLRERGVRVGRSRRGPRHGMDVVLTADYLAPGLDAINRRSLSTGRPWLIARPVGRTAWIGPIFDAVNGTPCWRCLALRLTETRAIDAYLAHHFPGTRLRRPGLAAHEDVLDAAADAVAARLARRLPAARRTPGDANGVETIDGREASPQGHRVARRPDCPCCGRRSPRAADVRPAASASTARTLMPAALARHVDPLLGIVTAVSLRRPPGPPSCVAVADHVFGPEIEAPESIWRGGLRPTAGGGRTPREARTSAVAEAIERYSGVFRATDRGRRASFEGLGPAAIHPNAVMSFSARQFARRAVWNARHPDGPTRVPEPFDERTARGWTPLTHVVSGRRRWLPTALCYFGVRPEWERRACRADSNGCAAGRTREEAILRGFLELVERDAVGIWWYNRVRRPGVDLRTIPDRFVQAAVRLHHRMGRDVRLLDVTTDLAVPAFAAVSSDAGSSSRRLTVGFGADLDPLRAIRRALIELGLFLPEIAAGRPRPVSIGAPARGRYLEPAGLVRWRHVIDLHRSRRVPPGDAGAASATVGAVAEAHGLDVYVLDHTRADVGVPVVRVVAPGLCHFWARWGAPRLAAVPVSLGWQSRPTPEARFNRALLRI